MRARGAFSLLALILSWLALDDITTDNAVEFPLEYAILIAAGMWFVALGAWLIAKRRWVAGAFSLVAVAIGVVAFWSLPHRSQPPSLVNYFGYLPLAWFLGLAIWLLATRGRAGRTYTGCEGNDAPQPHPVGQVRPS
jgi:peptidoglycan/LPS O-acetylase OafA/YrhL